MSSPVAALLFSLALTLAVEVPLAALLRVRGLDLLLVGIINCLTNPVVNLLYQWALVSFSARSPLPFVCMAALEIAVLFGEALLFAKLLHYRRIHPLLLSLILNAASFLSGEAVTLLMTLLR